MAINVDSFLLIIVAVLLSHRLQLAMATSSAQHSGTRRLVASSPSFLLLSSRRTDSQSNYHHYGVPDSKRTRDNSHQSNNNNRETNTRNNRSSSSSNRFYGPTAVVRSPSRARKACAFYLWNAPSALLHKWCQHLMKDNIYEGRGGVKFVRIEPGSVLQLLYPCTRYSPDSCVFCGGNFLDHMTLAWAKHLYTPFDRYVDTIRKHGVVVSPSAEQINTTGGGASSSRKASSTSASLSSSQPHVQPPRHVFHRRYVHDAESIQHRQPQQSSRKQRERIRPKASSDESEWRRFHHVTYQYPYAEPTILRAIVLMRLERLIQWEALDNAKAARAPASSLSSSSCCL